MKKALLLLSFTLFITLFATAQNVPSYVPTNGLVGWWPFNGNANDMSGNGNNGTVNGPVLTTDRFGQVNSSYLFNSGADLICTSQSFNSPNTFSYSVWLKSTTAGFLMGFNNGQCSHGGQWDRTVIIGGTNQFGFYTFPSTSITTNVSSNIIDNNWHHLVVTMNGSGSKIYLDGSQVGSNTSQTSGENYSGWFRFGGLSPNNANNSVLGKLDDIGIWNRALTQQEITNLYNASLPTTNCPTLPSNLQSGLVGYWPFCGNANDASGNGNYGTVNGATLTTDRAGNPNGAYYFNGTNNIQTLTSGPTGTGITLSFWYKTNQTMMMQTISYGSTTWGRYFGAYLHHYSAQTIGPCYGPSFTNAGTLINKNNGPLQDTTNWHHAVIIIPVNAANLTSLYFYLDGQELTNACSYANYGAPSPNIDNGNPIRFGAGWYSGTPYNNLVGSLDDICLWNRALTANEVAQLYAAQSVNPNNSTNSTPTVATNFPSGIAYQAVARDSTGQPIGNSAIGVRFTLRDSSLSGTVVYAETHNLTTNALGLFTTTIGSGTAQSGTYAGINWMGPVKFLQVEVNAGSGYQLIGGQQLLSVPYANAADNATKALKIKNASLPVFSDNTSALSGGLQPGDTYRTPTGILMIVY